MKSGFGQITLDFMRTNVDKGFCTNDMAGANGRKLYYVSIATHQKQINRRKWQLLSNYRKKANGADIWLRWHDSVYEVLTLRCETFSYTTDLMFDGQGQNLVSCSTFRQTANHFCAPNRTRNFGKQAVNLKVWLRKGKTTEMKNYIGYSNKGENRDTYRKCNTFFTGTIIWYILVGKGITKSSVKTTVVWMTKNCSQTLF